MGEGGGVRVVLGHERQEAVLRDVNKLVLDTRDDRLRAGKRRRADGLELLAGEDIDARELALGRTVLAHLGLGAVNNLAGLSLDQEETALADVTTSDGNAVSRSRIRRIEIAVRVRHLWRTEAPSGHSISTGSPPATLALAPSPRIRPKSSRARGSRTRAWPARPAPHILHRSIDSNAFQIET